LLSQEILTKNLCCGLFWSINLDKNSFIENTGCFSQGFPVEKKTLKAAVIISALLFSTVAGTQFVKLSTANFIQFSWGVLSPETKTYSVKTVPLIIRFTVYSYFEKWFGIRTTIVEIFYSVDERANVTVPITFSKGEDEMYTAETVLSGLSDGSHKVVAYAKDQNGEVFASEKTFKVDTTAPEISVFSLANKTYDKCTLSLNFTVNESVWNIKYSLDGEKNVSVEGNPTLFGLSYGVHNVTVYASDYVDNIGASETIFFTIVEPKPEPFPPTMVMTSMASVAFVGAGLLLYFKKRKRWRS
jgi:hypothetical protein